MKLQLLGAITTFLISSIPILFVGEFKSIIVQLVFLLIAFISSLSLFFYKDRPYSLYKMFHLFCLFFLSIAPVLQYKKGITLWGGRGFCDMDYAITSILVLVSILIYNSFYYLCNKSKSYFFGDWAVYKLASPFIMNKRMTNIEGCLLVFMAIVVLFLQLYVSDFNLFLLFLRGSTLEGGEILELSNEIEVSQPMILIVNNFFRPLGVLMFLMAYFLKLRNKWILLVLGFLMLLIDFPTAMPRFSAASLYIPILLYFSPFVRQKNMFVIICVFGLILIFPFLNNFRYFSEGQDIAFGFDFEMFTKGHFDSFSSFMRVVTNNIVTNGNQLLGSVFFWIPRSIWPTKPIGSGAFLADKLDLYFSNISCCYFAEGYINGGIIGLCIFIAGISIFSACIDKSYWNLIIKNKKKSCFELIYYMLLGLFFFMLRGDLLSSFAFMIGFVVSAISLYSFFLFLRKYKFVFK